MPTSLKPICLSAACGCLADEVLAPRHLDAAVQYTMLVHLANGSQCSPVITLTPFAAMEHGPPNDHYQQQHGAQGFQKKHPHDESHSSWNVA
jgi:hypothetical protein